MHRILIDSSATAIWKAVREAQGVPEPSPGMLEYQWARFLLGSSRCQVLWPTRTLVMFRLTGYHSIVAIREGWSHCATPFVNDYVRNATRRGWSFDLCFITRKPHCLHHRTIPSTGEAFEKKFPRYSAQILDLVPYRMHS
jgi:hypothetical protein